MLDRSAVSLDGKVVVVTGGGGGIGRSISETFAAHGAKVVVAERDTQRAQETVKAIEGRGGTALACVVDVQEKEQVAELSRARALRVPTGGRAREQRRRLPGHRQALRAQNRGGLGSALPNHLKHVFYCTHAFLPSMIERKAGGSVINISTIEAFRGIPGGAVYSAFNAAVTGFTKSMAIELGPSGILVNAIAPETTETLQVPVSQWISEENKQLISYWTPLGRFGKPDDAAGCALFLASDLSAWVSGTTVHMDGGALAAGGFYRVPGGGWTNMPVVQGGGIAIES